MFPVWNPASWKIGSSLRIWTLVRDFIALGVDDAAASYLELNDLEDVNDCFNSSSVEPNVLEDLDSFFDSSSAEPNVLEDRLFPLMVLELYIK
jgi:hypothetical protein